MNKRRATHYQSKLYSELGNRLAPEGREEFSSEVVRYFDYAVKHAENWADEIKNAETLVSTLDEAALRAKELQANLARAQRLFSDYSAKRLAECFGKLSPGNDLSSFRNSAQQIGSQLILLRRTIDELRPAKVDKRVIRSARLAYWLVNEYWEAFRKIPTTNQKKTRSPFDRICDVVQEMLREENCNITLTQTARKTAILWLPSNPKKKASTRYLLYNDCDFT